MNYNKKEDGTFTVEVEIPRMRDEFTTAWRPVTQKDVDLLFRDRNALMVIVHAFGEVFRLPPALEWKDDWKDE